MQVYIPFSWKQPDNVVTQTVQSFFLVYVDLAYQHLLLLDFRLLYAED